jgi:hypothetical protein
VSRGLSPDELAALIEEGESRRLEFKQGLSTDAKIARTLCAFANTRGGVLVVGVGDRGELWGLPRPATIAEQLIRAAEYSIDPPLEIEPRTVVLQTKKLVYVAVSKSNRAPHAVLDANGEREVVVRVGSSNRRSEGATLDALESAARSDRGLDPVEKKILLWIDRRDRRGARANSDATAANFAREHNLGIQRTKKYFLLLERRGLLVGHGSGANRAFARP